MRKSTSRKKTTTKKTAKTKAAKKPQKAVRKTRKKSTSNSSTPSNSAQRQLAIVKEYTLYMKEHSLLELEVQVGDMQLYIRRGEFGDQPAIRSVSQVNEQASVAPKANGVSAPVELAAVPVQEIPKNVHLISSPFVGTFYNSPGPGQNPFVQEGDVIKRGQTIAIVEAMKLMNEIESEVDGRVVRVLIESETPVEYGEALFEIELN